MKACDAIDYLGYSPEMVEHRRMVYQRSDEEDSVTDMYQTYVSIGSMPEGFASVFESAHDVLLVDKHVVCISDTEESDGDMAAKFPQSDSVFRIVSKTCHPGHFMLKIDQLGTTKTREIKRALVKSRKGYSLLSSEMYFKALGKFDQRKSRSRKFIVYDTEKGLSSDLKPRTFWAFRCTCARDLLKEWRDRPRPHGWPPRDVIEEVMEQEAQVVPVECSDRGRHKLEWRACFVKGEFKLSESLNEVQYKVFIILKSINKTRIQPLLPNMSTYLVKNVVFWMVEREPQTNFRKENIYCLVRKGLQSMLTAISSNCLQYYLIPGVNLLLEKIDSRTKRKVVAVFDNLIKDGPRVLLKCPKLSTAFTQMADDKLAEYGKARDKLEKLELYREHRVESVRSASRIQWEDTRSEDSVRTINCSEEQMKRLCFKMNDIVWPEWREFVEKELEATHVRELLDIKIHQALQ